MKNEPSKDPILRGVIRHARNRANIYGENEEAERAGFILPDGGKNDFTPDPHGVNVNGGKVSRLIYQAKIAAAPSAFGSSRSGAWLSTIWTAPPEPPDAKAVFYGYYLTAKGYQGDAVYPQSNSVLVVKGETAAGQAHGKTEVTVFAAAHERVPATSIEEAHGLLDEDGDVLEAESADSLVEEDGSVEAYVFTNGKLVCSQNVLVFDGPNIGWNHDPELDDDDGDGSLDGGDDDAPPGSAYPGYGTTWNNAGLTSGFAAGVVKARKPDAGGVPWTHGYYVSKRGAKAFSFRHQKSFGVSVTGFDPGDGSGARPMPYLGVGLDVAAAPLHLRGAPTIEQRLERSGKQTDPYGLGEIAFHGGTDFGVQTVKMGGLRLDVTRPVRGSEAAEAVLATRAGGVLKDRLRIGRGLWTEGAAGGDQGPGTLNLSGLFVDGELALGSDPAAADPVVPISVARTGKGMVVKSSAPDDRRFRGVQLYRHADTDDAAAAELVDFFPGRAGRKIKIVDTDGLDPGRLYFYYEASVSRGDVESSLRLPVGSAVYRGVQGSDMEDGAVDLAGTKVTGKDLANIDGARAGKLDGVETGATLGARVGSTLKDVAGTALATADVLNSQAAFAPRKRWAFKSSIQGWSLTSASQSLQAFHVTVTGTTTSQITLQRTGLSYPGAETYKVRMKLRPKQALSAGQWSGRCMWGTAGHGVVSASYYKALPLPAAWQVDEWRVLEWDMQTPTAGGTDWIDNTITTLAIDLTQVIGLAFDVAWIAIGDDGADALDLRAVADGATVGATAGTNIKDSGGAVVGDNSLLNNKAQSGRGYNKNPTFQRWTSGLPDNWSLAGTPTVTRQTTSPRYGDAALEVAYAATDNQYLFTSSGEIRVPPDDADYYFIEYEVELVSGDFNRAGVWWRVNYQDSSNFKGFTLDLNAEHILASAGNVYAGARVVAAAVTGTPTGMPGAALLHLIGNHALFGDTVSAKTLRWHRVEVRKATRQEIRTEMALDDTGKIKLANVDGAGPLAGRLKVQIGDIEAAAATPTALGAQRLSGLVLDPNFQDPDYWTCTNGGQIVTGTAGPNVMKCKAAFQVTAAAATASVMQAFAARTELIPCEPNAVYSVQAITRVTAGFNGVCQVGLDFCQYDGTASAITASVVISGVDHTSSPSPSATNEDLVGTFTTPADCDQIRVTPRVNFAANYPGSHTGNGLIGRLRITHSASYDDARIVGAAQTSANLSDLADVGAARNNLGLHTAATFDIGASGATIPLLNASNTTSGANTHTGVETFANFVNLANPVALTIASGVVTATSSSIAVDTQGAAASDDLDTINGGAQGHLLIVKTVAGARVVTLKDGTGNLLLAGDFVMDNPSDRATLIYQGTNWVEIARSNNS